MAERDVVGSLFGMTPESYQQALARRTSGDNLAAAQLTPGQLAGYYAMEAGSGLGRSAQGLLGVEDPELAKIRDVQSMRGQFDVSNPQGLRQFSQALGQKGYTDLAVQAATRAGEIEKTMAETQSKLRDQVKQVGLTTDGRQVYQSGANQFILTEQGPQPYYGPLESRQSKTNINVNTAGETQASKTIGEGIGKKILDTAAAGEAAADNLIKINETLNELKTGDAFTGTFAVLQTNIAKAQAKFAADEKAGKRVTDTEYLDALLGSEVFSMISSLGIGARGLDTPAEREFLRQVMTGTIGLEKDTLIKLTDTRRKIAERAVKKYNEKVESGELNEYFKIKGIQPKKIEIPKSDDSAALGDDYEEYAKYWVAKGKTPKTREQYIQDKRNLQGGKP